MTLIWLLTGTMLGAAGILTMVRMLAGPSTLDRLVALDTLIAVTLCPICIWAAASQDTTVTYSLAALALIGFIGSVSVARCRVPDNDTDNLRRRR